MSLLPTIEIQTQDKTAAPAASIIVLHGLGADGNDFVPFANELDLHCCGRRLWPNICRPRLGLLKRACQEAP